MAKSEYEDHYKATVEYKGFNRSGVINIPLHTPENERLQLAAKMITRLQREIESSLRIK